NDRDLVPHLPPRTLSGIEQLLVKGALPRLSVVANALQRRAVVETYEHCGQLRLLLPGARITDEAGAEAAREPAFLAQVRSFPSLAMNLPKVLAEFPWLLKDHAPINPTTHDGYVDRLAALPPQ